MVTQKNFRRAVLVFVVTERCVRSDVVLFSGVNLKKITFTWNSFVYIVHAVDVYKDKDVDVIYSIPMTYCCILLTHMCFH